MNSVKILSPSEALVNAFLHKAKEFQANIELIKVLKSRTYKIAEANVLIRASSDKHRRYFFGLNYLTLEEIANLDNPFIAFICGSIDRTIIIPAKLLFQYLPQISHDRNGEYKINVDRDLNIVLSGRNNRLNCKEFINSWELLLKQYQLLEEKNTVEESLHSIIQGRLLEIGNIRGLKTYCPDKSKKFNNKKLADIATLSICPKLEFSDYDLLRRIDVLWFRAKKDIFIPEKAFEVELTTGTWSGVGRMLTLIEYSSVGLYVISNDFKKFNQVMNTYYDVQSRYKHILNEHIGDLYAAEKNLKDLRFTIGL